MLYKKKFIIALNLIIVFVFFANVVCAEEIETYEVDNMEFTVGKHEPEKRVNSKKKKVEIITQTIIVGEDEQLPELLDEHLEENILGSKKESKKEKEKEKGVELEKVKLDNDEIVQETRVNPMGILTNDVWRIIKDVVFSASVVFENVVSYLDRVTFMDRVTFADKDMAGEAIIKKGSGEVQIVYEKQFITKPIVTVTAKDTMYNFFIQDETEEGFTIRTEEVIEEDLLFSWIAIKIVDPIIFKSENDIKKAENIIETQDEKKDDIKKIKDDIDIGDKSEGIENLDDENKLEIIEDEIGEDNEVNIDK